MEPLHFVFIMSHEYNADMLGCYGHGIVKTPHIAHPDYDKNHLVSSSHRPRKEST